MPAFPPDLEFSSHDLAVFLCEVEGACLAFPGWDDFATHVDVLVGRTARAERYLETSDPLAAGAIKSVNEMLEVTLGEIVEGPVRVEQPPRHIQVSTPSAIPNGIGVIGQAFVDATRAGLRKEAGFLRTVVRSVLQEERIAPPETSILTTAQAAALCGVTAKTIRAWVKSGRLEPLGGRPYKFSRRAVELARDRKPNEEEALDYAAKAEELLNRGRGR